MTTTEERLDSLEDISRRLADLTATLAETTLETREMVLEMRRENKQTRRIWIAIARKQELFDDDEFMDVFGEAQ